MNIKDLKDECRSDLDHFINNLADGCVDLFPVEDIESACLIAVSHLDIESHSTMSIEYALLLSDRVKQRVTELKHQQTRTE